MIKWLIAATVYFLVLGEKYFKTNGTREEKKRNKKKSAGEAAVFLTKEYNQTEAVSCGILSGLTNCKRFRKTSLLTKLYPDSVHFDLNKT